jgi:hypothetical protein
VIGQLSVSLPLFLLQSSARLTPPPFADHFLWIRYWNVRIMLLSLSLKFGPPTKPVLEEVSGAALATLGKVHEWAAEGESIIYASNSAVSCL